MELTPSLHLSYKKYITMHFFYLLNLCSLHRFILTQQKRRRDFAILDRFEVISNLHSSGAKLLPDVVASAQVARSSSSAPNEKFKRRIKYIYIILVRLGEVCPSALLIRVITNSKQINAELNVKITLLTILGLVAEAF